MKKKILALLLAFALLLSACGNANGTNENMTTTSDLSEVVLSSEKTEESLVEPSPEEEFSKEYGQEETYVEKTWMNTDLTVDERVELLLSAMTLEEKAYQMVQAEQANITADEIKNTNIGSVLSGGGSAPSTGNTVEDWNSYVNLLKEQALDSRLGIPLLYGVDAVHGHNNVYGATVFPHNIGLGAADDEDLMREIARVTAEEVKATGIQWDFSPCLGNPQDVTWGRTYECFSENPEDIAKLADDYIAGLWENGIIPCAKHYVGEGYTEDGINQGDVKMSDSEFDDLLESGVLEPYKAAVAAGALTVMPSYSSVNGVKCHENYHLLTEVLKEELGFKGFVISDYNAIEQLTGNTLKDQLANAINAGVDMVMQPTTWNQCAKFIVELVNEGKVTGERVDDAVRRILYVKFTAGLFEEEVGADANREYIDSFGSQEHREVARRAVRESLVLLKEDEDALARLREATFITVEGQAAYNMGRQCGGWTISWQGQSGNITLGTTIIEGIYGEVKDYATLKHSVDGSFSEETNGIIAVFGEVPYAETDGDRDKKVTICGADTEMLNKLKENINRLDESIPVIGIVLAGRPIDLSEYEDIFDVIIMAWLPGTEGEGISDVLFGDYEFTGELKYTWPY